MAQRPFDPFLVGRVIGQKSGEKSQTVVGIAPYETIPDRWATLLWRFYETGEPIVFGKPDANGWRWHLVTVGEMLQGFTHIHPHAALDAAGMPCQGHTRGPLRRMSIRDGEKFIVTKESLTWSDDPASAFTTPLPEVYPVQGSGNPAESCDWTSVRAALEVVGAVAVARRVGLDPRSVRHWLAGRSLPEDPRSVAEAVVASADNAGLVLPAERADSADAICVRVPERAAIVQLFVAAVVDAFIRASGARELSRDTGIPEKTLRYWRGLANVGGLRPIRDTNAIAAKLARVARAKVREADRRIRFEKGPVGDWQAIYCWLLLLAGDSRPQVPRLDLFAFMAGIPALAFSIFPFPAAEIAGELRESQSKAG